MRGKGEPAGQVRRIAGMGLVIPSELFEEGEKIVIISRKNWDKVARRLDRTAGLGLGMLSVEWLEATVPSAPPSPRDRRAAMWKALSGGS